MHLVKRMKQPTPSFFRKIRNVGLAVASVGGVLLTAPVALPEILVSISGYLTVAGSVASAVSQAVTEPNEEDKWKDEVKPRRRR